MNNLMAVLWNGIAQIEYDRNKSVPDYQGAYLDKMDRKMAAGIDVAGHTVEKPDLGQRAQFVAANLAHAFKANDEALAAAMCTWLAERMSDLQQVKISESEDQELSIELVFDEPYVKQVPVTFDLLKKQPN